jgi:hypothetical protein
MPTVVVGGCQRHSGRGFDPGLGLKQKYGTAIVENLTCEPLEWQYMTPDFLLSTVGEVQGQSNFVC